MTRSVFLLEVAAVVRCERSGIELAWTTPNSVGYIALLDFTG
jgi:hypothetical protein